MPLLSLCLLTRGFAAVWRILPPASGLNFPVSCLLHLLSNPESVHKGIFFPLSQCIIPNVKAVGQAQITNHVTFYVL